MTTVPLARGFKGALKTLRRERFEHLLRTRKNLTKEQKEKADEIAGLFREIKAQISMRMTEEEAQAANESINALGKLVNAFDEATKPPSEESPKG